MRPDPPPVVLAPRQLAGYQCGRSLVCCAAPWRATLLPGELQRIGEQLAATDEARLSRAQFEAAVHVQRPPGVLKQPGGDCALLDRPRAQCTLQAVSGLQGLPAGCRNFPRSVVRTPDGDEAAFSLACPTAAALVVAQPIAFAWAPASWPAAAYPPHRTVDDRVTAARGADWGWREFRALRQAWWQTLATCTTGDQLAATFAGMMLHPLDPGAIALNDVPWDRLCAPWTQTQVRSVTEGLARLPDTGPQHSKRQRERWAAWLMPIDAGAWRDSADRHLALVASHAGLLLQFAFVHDGLAVGPAIVRCAHLAAALARIVPTLSDGAQPTRDALIAAAHLSRGMPGAGALP